MIENGPFFEGLKNNKLSLIAGAQMAYPGREASIFWTEWVRERRPPSVHSLFFHRVQGWGKACINRS